MAHSTSTSVVIHHSNHAHGHPAPADVIVDALPYYDSGYDEPGVRETVCDEYSVITTFTIRLSLSGSRSSRRRNTSLQADEKLSGTTRSTHVPFV